MTSGTGPSSPTDGHRGPYAAGPPARALRVVAPSLTRFGWRELGRGVEIWAVLVLFVLRAVVVHAVRHPRRAAEALDAARAAAEAAGRTAVAVGWDGA
ncbi:MAG TPA: hypothetical protein VF015_07635, partial [Acidimicrobiales bacterium]